MTHNYIDPTDLSNALYAVSLRRPVKELSTGTFAADVISGDPDMLLFHVWAWRKDQ